MLSEITLIDSRCCRKSRFCSPTRTQRRCPPAAAMLPRKASTSPHQLSCHRTAGRLKEKGLTRGKLVARLGLWRCTGRARNG